MFQRGSDELLSQSGAVSNGAAMSPQPHHAADNNNDAKKVSDMINIRSSEYCLVNPIFMDYGFYEDPCFLLKQKLFLKDRFTEKNSLKIPSFPAKVK